LRLDDLAHKALALALLEGGKHVRLGRGRAQRHGGGLLDGVARHRLGVARRGRLAVRRRF